MAQTPVGGEPREGIKAPANQGNGNEKPPSPGAALLEELGRFVRQAAHQPEPLGKAPPQVDKWQMAWQMAGLLGVTLDVALLYVNFQEWFENPLLRLALKVLPWLLGATALPFYSDWLRDRTLALCRHWTVAAFSVLIALPLLLARLPVFSMLVSVDSDSITIEPDDPKDKLDILQPEDKLFRIVAPDLLKPYRVTVRDPATEDPASSANGLSKAFSPLLRRPRILWSTLAQIALVGRIFGQPRIKLAPLYELPTHSSTDGAHALIQGKFEEGYLEFLKRSGEHVCSRRAPRLGRDQIWCNVGVGDDALFLPPGRYDFTLFRGKCTSGPSPIEIRKQNNDTIEFEKLCPQ